MSQKPYAVLSIRKDTRKGSSEFKFELKLPEAKPLDGQTTLPAQNQEQINETVKVIAQRMSSGAPDEQEELIKLGKVLYGKLPHKIREALKTAEYPVLIEDADTTIPWELSHDGENFLFVRTSVGRMPDLFPEDATNVLAPSGETLSALIIAPPPKIDQRAQDEELEDVRALTQNLAPLRRELNDRFNDEELHVLCFDLGIEYDNLRGQIRAAKAGELIAAVVKANRLDELIKLCAEQRPAINWQSLAGTASNQPEPASRLTDSSASTAQSEAQALCTFLREQGVEVSSLIGDEATYMNVTSALADKPYHMIHICGQTEVDRDYNLGIILAGGVLTIEEIRSSLQGNPLVFANTCVLSRAGAKTSRRNAPFYSAKLIGLSAAFVDAERGRAIALIGTPWRVSNIGASQLPLTFYRALFAGQSVGEALQAARKAVQGSAREIAWASFALWGLPDLRLRLPVPAATLPETTPEPKPEPESAKVLEVQEPIPPSTVENILVDGRPNPKRLDSSARQVFNHAELEMSMTGVDFISTAHLFIGLTKIEAGVTQAALRHQGFNPQDVRDYLRGNIFEQAGFLKAFLATLAASDESEPEKQDEEVGVSESVRDILLEADQIARTREQGSPLVEEHDLLLGFLKQGGGTTRDVLKNLGVNLASLQSFAQGKPTQPAQHPLFDAAGKLQTEKVSPEVQRILERAWQEAHRGTRSYLATPYLIEALYEQGQYLQAALRAQQCDLDAVKQALHAVLHDDGAETPEDENLTELHLYDLSRRVQDILRSAESQSHIVGADNITEIDLLLGFLRSGGGGTRGVLVSAGVDLAALETFVSNLRLPASLASFPSLFLPGGRLNLHAFDDAGRRALNLMVQESANLNLDGVDTRRLVIGLATLPGGAFAEALARQGWSADRLREALQGRFRGKGNEFELTHLNISRSVLLILERAWTMAGQEHATVISERHMAVALLRMGGRWTGGGLAALGIDVERLETELAGHFTASPSDGAAPSAPPAAADNLFLPDRTLNRALFDEHALSALDRAAAIAVQWNHQLVGTPHLFVGLLNSTGGVTLTAVLAQGLLPDTLQAGLSRVFASPAGRGFRISWIRDYCSPTLFNILDLAQQIARQKAVVLIGERELLAAFLREGGGQCGRALESMGLRRQEMLTQLGESPPAA